MTKDEALKQALELLAVATYHSPDLQAKRTEVIEQGLKALSSGATVAQHYVDGGHLVYPPAQRTWVGLTDWEISQLWIGTSPYFNEDDFARAIEAKLKEKNT